MVRRHLPQGGTMNIPLKQGALTLVVVLAYALYLVEKHGQRGIVVALVVSAVLALLTFTTTWKLIFFGVQALGFVVRVIGRLIAAVGTGVSLWAINRRHGLSSAGIDEEFDEVDVRDDDAGVEVFHSRS